MKIITPTTAPAGIVFTSKVDDDGDYAVYANGDLIAYFSSEDGKLHRMCMTPSEQETLAGSGMVFDADDKIAVSAA